MQIRLYNYQVKLLKWCNNSQWETDNHFKMSIKNNNSIPNLAKPNCYFHSCTWSSCLGPNEQLTCKRLPCHFWRESVSLVYGVIPNRGAPLDWNWYCWLLHHWTVKDWYTHHQRKALYFLLVFFILQSPFSHYQMQTKLLLPTLDVQLTQMNCKCKGPLTPRTIDIITVLAFTPIENECLFI